jgi:dihydroorotate dehydrogenase
MLYKKLLRPALFKLEPERVHDLTSKFLSSELVDNLLKPFMSFEDRLLNVKAGRLTFRNPIGLAAGMDKNCTALGSWDAIGFGFAETGTVTPLPQKGNPKPRMFRLTGNDAIINSLGFNNCGADEFFKNIAEGKEKVSNDFITGVNIGKNSMTSLKNAIDDYRFTFEKLYEHADYFTINVSSPNTEGLRQLQHKEYLDDILNALQELNHKLDQIYACDARDIYLKIAPDLLKEELDNILEVSIKNQITGIVATNTTVERDMLDANAEYPKGGLSGKPLRQKSNDIINYIHLNAKEKLVIIGCGGIFNFYDVLEKLNYGASLIQLYTGFVYEGPFLIKKLKKQLYHHLNMKK